MFSVVALLLYWLAASGFSDGVSHRMQVDQATETTGTPLLIAEELPFELGFAVKEGTSFLTAASTSVGPVKQLQFYKAIISASEVQVACTLMQCDSHLHNNPVRTRKSDMLFPFHYFFEPARA